MKRVSIDEVANRFTVLGFDDTRGKQYCRRLLVELQSNHETLQQNDSTAKTVMIKAMHDLLTIIDQHLAGEFMALPELFDAKYNHHYVLFWIVVRDYNGVQDLSLFPTWYPGLAKLMDWNSNCRSVLTTMINYLER
jgi:hypothetical protein